MNGTRQIAAQPTLESRLALRLAGALTQQSLAIGHDVSERLRFAREQAVSRARQVRAQTAGATVMAGTSATGAAVLAGFLPWWQRAASVLPLVVLVAGIFMIQRWATHEQVATAAEIDAQLLTDDLPPAAYSDPGFGEYLRVSPSP